MTTILWQRLEGALILAVSLALLVPHVENWSYLWLFTLFFVPDLAFAAYLFGPRVGAMAYNFLHLYGLGAVLYGLGMLYDHNLSITLGLLWLGHAGFDRALGYGLKSREGFVITHLGKIGKNQNARGSSETR